ncbi:MAG: methylated-DNA--[protein]-cysteine S-methyltransferase [Pseudomonadota bacterium]|nr:methylated-DNA--[protein]-cysteine S-methyltransferase [Pseudomonadota bacterium]
MTAYGFTLFDTTIGRCGIVWSVRGIASVQLPEARERDTRARILQRFPNAHEASPPSDVKHAIDGIVALLCGEASDLSGIVLDMAGVPPFYRRVYEIARAIAPGATLSYGDVALRLGAPGSARAVGQALGRNPFAIVVPCHRVIAASGKLGGFSANGGITTKLRLLSIESAQVNGPLFEGDSARGFDPDIAIEHLRASDTALARVIGTVGPFRMRLKRTPNIFVALTEAIVYQQLTGKAAATIFARLCTLFPHRYDSPTAEQILRVSNEKLRAVGLSRSKLLSLRDLAQRTVEGKLPTLAEVYRMEDEAIIERLTEVRGIGRWTVEMLLIFHLGRADILPVDDYGIRKGFAIAVNKSELPTRKEVEKRGARWRPYRSVASWYLWRAVELARR